MKFSYNNETNVVPFLPSGLSVSKGVVIAGTHSGSGKTTVTLGILAALQHRGFSVAPFKVGPDFIDPSHHRQVAGKQSRNLDGWMLSQSENRHIFARGIVGADLAVVEGVMGLFDGYDGRSEAGSTAQMAKWLDLDILLVVDARSMARSAGALVYGFTQFDPDCQFCGVVFNNVGSVRHLKYLCDALEEKVSIPVLGGLPRNPDLKIPDRHLGLMTADDHPLSEPQVMALAGFVEEHLDLDRLIEGLPEIVDKDQVQKEEKKGRNDQINRTPVSDLDVIRIGVARDKAFCFYYPDNFEVLEENGAKIVFFSPVNDRELPSNLDGLYLGGGYPELHAGKLSMNISMRKSIYQACKEGMPVYAECGGFMYLCEKLITKQDDAYEMVGCFPFASRMKDRLTSLGYREIKLSDNTPLGEKGLTARGHEFHYSYLEEEKILPKIQNVYESSDRSGKGRSCPGYLVNQCLGSYVHLHFRSCPEIGRNFISACRVYQNR
jgi:cobyrinic acid a,c-diamide synthase